MKGGHRALCRECKTGPTAFLVSDPCPFGLPETLTVAHVSQGFYLSLVSGILFSWGSICL